MNGKAKPLLHLITKNCLLIQWEKLKTSSPKSKDLQILVIKHLYRLCLLTEHCSELPLRWDKWQASCKKWSISWWINSYNWSTRWTMKIKEGTKILQGRQTKNEKATALVNLFHICWSDLPCLSRFFETAAQRFFCLWTLGKSWALISARF